MPARPMQSFRTGLRLAGFLSLITLVLASWISWDIYHDPFSSQYHDLPGLSLLVAGFCAIQLAIALSLSFQRIKLDSAKQKLAYATIGTLHRWREIPVADIRRIKFYRAADSYRGMVDKLAIGYVSPAAQPIEQWVELLDKRMMSLSNQPSDFFDAIIDFVRQHNPGAELPPQR